MTKRQTAQWHKYLESYEKYGCRTLQQVYCSFSSRKYNAWSAINIRRIEEDGFCYTVTGGGSHYFSTDYIRPIDGGYEWVHDSASRTQRIVLNEQMLYEARRSGIREPWIKSN